MESSVELIGSTRIRLVVEVQPDEWELGLKKGFREITARANVAGWRGCKVPFQVIDQRLGATVLPQVLERAVLAAISAAAQTYDLTLMGRPEVDISAFADDCPLRFTAVVDIRPQIVLPELSAIVVDVDPVVVGDGEIDAHMEELRRRSATFDVVRRPAAVGDVLRLGVRASVGGVPSPVVEREGVGYELGSQELPEELDDIVDPAPLLAGLDKVVGLPAGESVTMRVPLVGGEFAGRDADVSVTVEAVTECRLPDVDDQLAASAGLGTVAELRDSLRDQLIRTKKDEQKLAARGAVIKAIVAAAAVSVPESFLHDQVAHRKRWMESELGRIGTSLAEQLTALNKTEEEIDAELLEAAMDRIGIQIVLDALADAEEIQVTAEEYESEVVDRAKQVNVPAQMYHDQTMRAGVGSALLADIRRDKAAALIMRTVTVKDTEGNPVNLGQDDLPAAANPAPEAGNGSDR